MALIYGALTTHPALTLPLVSLTSVESVPQMSDLGAKASAAMVITFLFGLRASILRARSLNVPVVKASKSQ